MELKKANGKEQFQMEARAYVINMLGNRRMLHKKNGCKDSTLLHKYYDFASLEDVVGIEYIKCSFCFPSK